MVSSLAVTETQFAEQFRELLNGSDDGLRAFREEAFEYFQENGFPSVKNEDWKYTNVAPIARENWIVAPVSPATDANQAASYFKNFNFIRNGFTALNAAFAHPVIYHIPRETSVSEPIEISFGADEGRAIFPYVVIVAEAGSKATLVETYASPTKSFTNSAVQIIVEDNASLTHFRVQKDSAEAFHVGTTEIALARGSYYNATNINLGAALSRHDIDLKFTAEGASGIVDGLYMLNGMQHADTHSVIDHLVPNCTSGQNYKGVLNDKSRAVFNGIVFVRENATGTDAQQSNKNLLLSNEARVDTKPQLEIFNDDVKCSHGATVGQLEEEELFYLLTRGLPETLARNLLTYGFAEEILYLEGAEID
jgi:Fe-S cluster assembly protein SufD